MSEFEKLKLSTVTFEMLLSQVEFARSSGIELDQFNGETSRPE